MSFKDSCNFTKVVPNENMCHNHKSVGSFRQGIFDTQVLNVQNRADILAWIEDNKDIIHSVECFLLKHPLFEFPLPAYPIFQFVHHSQIGFIFKDKDGKQIRHFCMQLQNAWFPVVSPTIPVNLAYPCKIKDENGSKIHNVFLDPTGIYCNFLEKGNYLAEEEVMMNKNTYFRGINLQYLGSTVTFDFFVESYKLWRMQNTNLNKDEIKRLGGLDGDKISPLINLGLYDDYSQNEDTTTVQVGAVAPFNKPRLNGTEDGKLFVFSTFSPSYWSYNEGAILNFASIKPTASSPPYAVANKMKDFVQWTFNNLQCYKNDFENFRGYSRNYITLSPSSLSFPWISTTDLTQEEQDILKTSLRGDSKNSPTLYNDDAEWDDNGAFEKAFEKVRAHIKSSRNLGNILPNKSGSGSEETSTVGFFGYDYSSCPFVPTGANYNCELWSSMVVTQILNTDNFIKDEKSKEVCKVERKFNFNFPNTKFVPSSDVPKKPDTSKEGVYKGPTNTEPSNVGLDANYNVNDNLMRAYSAYWPVAIYEEGYENGIPEHEFNNTDKYANDREEYAKQSAILEYFMKGLNVEAASATGNSLIKALSEVLSFPFAKLIANKTLGNSSKTILPMLTTMMYILFLVEFLEVETIFLAGYPVNDISKDTYTPHKSFDCEPFVYKFSLGSSNKRGKANLKLFLSLLEWITMGKTEFLGDFKIFKNAELSSSERKRLEDLENKLKDNAKNLVKDAENLLLKKPTDMATCDAGKDAKSCGKEPASAISSPIEYAKWVTCTTKKTINDAKNEICEIGNTMKKVKYYGENLEGLASNGVGLISNFIKAIDDPSTDIKLVELLINFGAKKLSKFVEILLGNLNRFSTWCHQNYELHPYIMNQTYFHESTNYPDNRVGRFGNLRREGTTAFCKEQKLGQCALAKTLPPTKSKDDPEFYGDYLDNAEFSLLNVVKNNTGLVLLILLIILLFVGLWIYLYRKTKEQ